MLCSPGPGRKGSGRSMSEAWLRLRSPTGTAGGDPDLHTHVAVANKVQTIDGRWLSIDGRVLFKANVAASEIYNTALEQHLRDTLGVRFAERSGTDSAKRPI
jgi:TrwC relaxase